MVAIFVFSILFFFVFLLVFSLPLLIEKLPTKLRSTQWIMMNKWVKININSDGSKICFVKKKRSIMGIFTYPEIRCFSTLISLWIMILPLLLFLVEAIPTDFLLFQWNTFVKWKNKASCYKYFWLQILSGQDY